MASRTRRAFTREYYREWRRAAWKRALFLERRVGLLIATALAGLLAVAERIVGIANNVGGLLLAVAGVFVVIFVVIYVIAWFTAPAHLAWGEHLRRENEGEEYETFFSVGHDPDGRIEEWGPPILSFPTANKRNRYFPVGEVLRGKRIRILRFVDPLEATVSRADLPHTLQLPGRGRLVIKEYTDNGGVLLDEIRTSGRNIRAEIYAEGDA